MLVYPSLSPVTKLARPRLTQHRSFESGLRMVCFWKNRGPIPWAGEERRGSGFWGLSTKAESLCVSKSLLLTPSLFLVPPCWPLGGLIQLEDGGVRNGVPLESLDPALRKETLDRVVETGRRKTWS